MNWRKPMRDRCAQSGIIGVLVACSASVAQQADWYVDADGAGSDPWDAAYTDLQTVLTSPYLDPGEVIWVAAGTYKPATTADRDASFELVSEVKMYGGFHGGQDGETLLAERDIFTNETILSGDIPNDNTYHVVYAYDNDEGSRLDGFTIRDGWAGAESGSESTKWGAGMYVVGSQIAVVNCTFTENVAGYTFTNQYGFPASCPGKGGGMFVKNHLCAGVGSVDLVDCRFTDNQAIGGGWGGAVYNFGNAQMQAMIRATNCLFADNQADPLVYSYEEEWYITQAKAGAICNQFGQVQLINCTVADNTAGEWQCKGQGTGYCGGIYSAGAPTPLADLDVVNCIVWGNRDANCANPPCGGASAQIEAPDGDCDVSYCDIEGGWAGVTNINVDPEFVTGTYRLQATSPCLDVGSNGDVPVDTFDVDDDGNEAEKTPDLDLSLRVSHWVVDMGAYEFCNADINDDGVADVIDLLALLEAWGDCPDPPAACPADIDGSGGEPDGVVDVVDLLSLIADWGCGVPKGEPAPEDVCDCIQRYGDNIERLTACIEAIILSQGGE